MGLGSKLQDLQPSELSDPQIWSIFSTCRVDEGRGCLAAVQNKLKALAFTAFCEYWSFKPAFLHPHPPCHHPNGLFEDKLYFEQRQKRTVPDQHGTFLAWMVFAHPNLDPYLNYFRKDNMDRWKGRGEKWAEERRSEKRKSQKKEDAGARKCRKSRNTVFFGSLKRRVRSHVAR